MNISIFVGVIGDFENQDQPFLADALCLAGALDETTQLGGHLILLHTNTQTAVG